jgi:formylglycine-generating enzyme
MNIIRSRVWFIAAAIILGLGLALSLYLAYLLSLEQTATVPPSAATVTPTTEIVLDPLLSTAARIRNRGRVRVGVRLDVQPFGLLDAGGQPTGFDVDLAREFARRWLGDPGAVDLIPVTAADRIPRLLSGEVDLLLAALEQRRERDAFIDFSQDYYRAGYTLLTRVDAGINDVAALQGRTVGVLPDPPALELIRTTADRAQIELTINTYQEYPQALQALLGDQIAAVVGDSVTLVEFVRAQPGLQLLGGRLSQQPYAIGLPQGDSDFRELVNATLQTLKRDGTYDALYQHWFPTDAPFALEMTLDDAPLALDALPERVSQPERTRIQQILERGRLVAGVTADLSPFGVREEGGRLAGFDIDLVREFARRWLGDEAAVELVSGSPAEQVARVVAGEIDLAAAGLPHRHEWATQIDFSQSYARAEEQPRSLGLPFNDAMFHELVNVTLQEMKADGTYDRIYSRWFGDQQPHALVIVPGDADYLLLPSVGPQPASLRVEAPARSVIARIRARGNVLVAGVNEAAPPFSTVDDAGQASGFDVELLRALAQQWGVEVKVVPVNFTDQIDRLLAGEIDLIAGALSHTKEREAAIDFTQTYFVSGQSLLVRRDGGVNSLLGLNNGTVAGLVNTPFLDQLQAQADANGLTVTLQPYGDYASALAALKAGQVQALTADSVTLAQFAQADAELTVAGGLLTQEPFGWGLPPGDAQFRHLINATLQTLKRSGRYDELYRQWFGADATPYALEVWPGQWPYGFADSPTQPPAPVQSRVDQILARGMVLAGVSVEMQPFGFLDAGGQPAGFEVDLVREFAKRWLGDEAAVEFLPVAPGNRVETVVQTVVGGQVDLVAAALTHTQERDETIDLSQTYFTDGQGILVRQDAGLTTLADLGGRTVAAIQGTPAAESLHGAAAGLGVTLTVLPFQEHPPAIEALKAGQVDAVAASRAVLDHFAQENSGFVVMAEELSRQPYGLGLPNNDDRFLDLVNFTLQEMKLDGSFDRLVARWFGPEKSNALEIWPGRSYLRVNLTPMRRIPAGPFVRGTNSGFPDERPEQVVELGAFYLDQFEITNRLYAQCVNAGRCTLPRLPRSVNFSGYYAQSIFGNYPAIWVSWQDAANYCKFAGKRLPTEAEWEKAARGEQPRLYPWGNDEPTNQLNFNYVSGDVAQVGSFAGDVSPYGVYDLAGNVREWVADWYQWDYYPITPAQNPTGPATGVTRVLRGGSWNDVAVYVRTTVRKNYLPESYDSNLGFRCASSAPPTP